MRSARLYVATIATLALLSATSPAARQNGNDLYQQGLARETAGDIKGAMQIFERIVREQPSNRTLVARALVQLGRWSDVLGEDQAQKYYERVIRDYADQKDAAAAARARLDAIARPARPDATPAGRLLIDWTPSADNAMTITRDGRHRLRYNEEQRAFELVEISTGDVHRLTTEGPNRDEGVVAGSELSTNGRRLAATLELRKPRPNGPAALERTELRVFEAGGTGPGRVIATWDGQAVSVHAFAWAPRNDRIWVFVMRSDSSAQIASVELTGKLQVLKTLTWRDHAQPPSLSPDGRFVAYHDATSRETRPDIYILATDGSAEYRAEHPADDNKPIFAPDGSGVVFASDRRGIRDLWFLALKGGKPAGEPRLVWRNVGPFGLVQRFTESGSLLFYFAVNDVGVYTVPLDVNATETIGQPTRLAPLLNEGNSGAVFSPDGRYLSHFRADASRIVLRELATGVEREIPFGAPLRPGYANADWCSSSGTLIATGNIQGTGWVSYRVNVKDGSAQRLPISLPPVSPFFPVLCAADGDEIIYVPIAYPPGAPAAEPSIIRRSLATGRETTLFKGAVQMLARSMDGNRLAFVTIDPNADVARVVTMSATGGDISATVFTSGTYEYQGGRAPHIRDVVWMPGGDRLLLAVNESTASMALWEVPIMGSTSRKLGSLPLPKKGLFPGATRLSVHPDGKQFAFQSREGFVRQTWAIENLMQFIKAGGGK